MRGAFGLAAAAKGIPPSILRRGSSTHPAVRKAWAAFASAMLAHAAAQASEDPKPLDRRVDGHRVFAEHPAPALKQTKQKESWRSRAKALDRVAKQLEQYGTITASAPLLVSADGNSRKSEFEFALQRGASAYYADARQDIQGALAASMQSSANVEVQGRFGRDTTAEEAFNFEVGQVKANEAQRLALAEKMELAAKAEFDALMTLAAEEKDPAKRGQLITTASDRYQAALRSIQPAAGKVPTASTFGTGPNATEAIASPNIAATANPIGAFDQAFALSKLLTSSSPVVTNRSAIIAAAGDNTVEGIFRLLGDPAKATESSGRSAFFGVTMISVTPGHRTRRKYAADITVQTGLTLQSILPGEVTNMPGLARISDAARARLMCDAFGPDATYSQACTVVTYADALLSFAGSLARNFARLSNDPAVRNSEEADAKAAGLRFIQAQSASHAWLSLPPDLRGWEIKLRRDPPEKRSNPEWVSAIIGGSQCWGDLGNFDLQCELGDEYAPTVAAVSPMTESQVLDLGLAQRERQRFAIDLAAALQGAGQNQSARIFAEYAEQLQQDAITRTPQNLVTGYSSGSIFGYQVGPGLAAIEEPGSDDPEVGQSLQRQSFPALLVINIRSDLARSRVHLVQRELENGEVIEYLTVLKPHVRFDQSWRWSPRRTLWAPWFRLSEVERTAWMQDLEDADGAGGNRLSHTPDDFVRTRADMYRRLVGITPVQIPLPERAASRPRIDDVSPSKWTLDSDNNGNAKATQVNFVLRGAGLADGSLHCLLRAGGKVFANVPLVQNNEYTAVCPATLPADGAGTVIVSVAANATGADPVYAASTVQIQKPSAPATPKPPATFKYEVATPSGKSEYSVYAPAAKAEQALELVKQHVAPEQKPVTCLASNGKCCQSGCNE